MHNVHIIFYPKMLNPELYVLDVILWNVTYSVPNTTWTMTPATSGVDPQRARQLEDYIKLNYSDSFLHIGLVKPLDKEELYSNFNVI